jgi:hypothetical protein
MLTTILRRRLTLTTIATFSFNCAVGAPSPMVLAKAGSHLPEISATQLLAHAQTGFTKDDLKRFLRNEFTDKKDLDYIEQIFKGLNFEKVYIDGVKRTRETIAFFLSDGRAVKLDFRHLSSGIVLLNGSKILMRDKPALRDLVARINAALDRKSDASVSGLRLLFEPKPARAFAGAMTTPLVIAGLLQVGAFAWMFGAAARNNPGEKAGALVKSAQRMAHDCEWGPEDTRLQRAEAAMTEAAEEARKADEKTKRETTCVGAFLATVYRPEDRPQSPTAELATQAADFCEYAQRFNFCWADLKKSPGESRQRTESAKPATK